MIPLLLAAAAVAATPQSRFDACVALTRNDPAKAVEVATEWRLQGGGVSARQCLGLAFAAGQRWAPAAAAFEQAARAAEAERDGRVLDLWSQSGNAALAADKPAEARAAFDAALATGQGNDEAKGEVHMDRARAWQASGDSKAALADLARATLLVPKDPMGWLLKATLERRAGNLAVALHDVGEAEKLAPDNPDVALEAGNIAAVQGDLAAARSHWQRAAASGDARAAKVAKDALAANGE